MNRTRKLLSVVLLALFLVVGICQKAMAGVDLGVVGSSDLKTVSISETVGQGEEKYLLFRTAPGQTEYRLIIGNVHAGITSFHITIYLNSGPNTVVYKNNIASDYIEVTELLKLEADTDYYIELNNSTSTDSSVVPEVKLTLESAGAKTKVEALTLDKSKLLIKKGDKAVLKADYVTDKADKSLSWKSSDTKVAKVSSKGTITAVNAGNATITCTSKIDSGLKATCKVTVVTEASGIKISKKTASIDEGSSVTLKASIEPSSAKNQPIIWKSSDKSIASVSEKGVVTGIKKGTAKITATVQYKNKNTIVAVCKVTVKESKAKDKSDVELTIGQGNNNIAMTYQYAAGSCYAADGYYTLKVGNYKGDLNITFNLTNGSDTRVISVEPNSTYYLTYTYSFKEDKGTTIKIPQYTYQWDPFTNSMKEITTYKDSTIPAASKDSDLSVSVSGKVCKNTTSATGSFEKGALNYIKK